VPMLKSLPLRGVLVICGSAVALTVATLPAQAATTGWRAAARYSVKGEQSLQTGIDAVTAKDAWAVGAAVNSSGTKALVSVEHWAGKSWQRVALPSKVAKVANSDDFAFSAIAASSSTNAWVFGEIPFAAAGDSYLRLNGKTWSTGTLPDTKASGGVVAITAAVAVSSSEVWVFGGRVKPSSAQESYVPYAAEFNGHSWSVKSVPGTGEVSAASAVSARNIWAVTGITALDGTGSSSAKLLHWNGTSWLAAASQPTKLPAGADLSAVLAQSNGDVWIAGSVPTSSNGTKTQFTDKLTGSKWASAPTDLKSSASSQPFQPVSIAPDGSGLWALGVDVTNGSSKLWHFSGGAWSSATSPKFGGTQATLLQLAAVPGTSSVWAAGEVEVNKTHDGLIGIDGPTPN
jgi:hypothetical protein